MNNSDGMQDEGNTEDTRLIERKESWTKMDRLLLVFAVLVYMGDGCETYLPGTSFLKYTTLMTIFVYTCRRTQGLYWSMLEADWLIAVKFQLSPPTSIQIYTHTRVLFNIQYLFDSQYRYNSFI